MLFLLHLRSKIGFKNFKEVFISCLPGYITTIIFLYQYLFQFIYISVLVILNIVKNTSFLLLAKCIVHLSLIIDKYKAIVLTKKKQLFHFSMP